jgi:hypothetical protein
MSWGAIAGAAIGVVGGAMSSRSARKAGEAQAAAGERAADAQLQAAREANQLQASMYRQGLASSTPYTQGGQVALSALMSGLGLGGARSSFGALGTGSGAGGTGDVGGTSSGMGMYFNAAGEPVDAQGNVITDPTAQFGGIGNLNVGATQAEMDAAAAGVPAGSLTRQFTAEDFLAGMDPGYDFRMKEGNAALQARRAAVGNRFGGQALKDIANYNQEAASQEYGNAFNRYQTNQGNIYNRLAALAGIGQTQTQSNTNAGAAAAGAMGSNLIAGAGNASNYLTGAAASRAAGQVGSTNAIVGGLQSGLGNYYLGNLYNQGRTGGAGGGVGGSTRGYDPYSNPNYFGGGEGE